MYYCPKCKRAIATSNDVNALTVRCQWCGTVVSFSIEVATSENDEKKHAQAPPPSTSILGKCPGCGVDNPGDNRYCSGCGAFLCEICPTCNGEARIGLRFCGKCGVDIPKQKKIINLKGAISKHLEAASEKKDDIATAAEILLDAVKLEEDLVKISDTENENMPPITAHLALDTLIDEKTLSFEFLPYSGTRQIEFLSRVSQKLPNRKDILSKIEDLSFQKDNLLKELKKLFQEGHFFSIIQMASSSMWSEHTEIATIVADAQESLTKINILIESQIPGLLAEKKYYELNKILDELKRFGSVNEGLGEIRKETESALYRAKQLYENALDLNSAKKLIDASHMLENLHDLCSDYPDASNLQEEIGLHIFYYSKKIKKIRIAGILLLSCISIIIIAISVNKYFNCKTYNSYYEKANIAFSNKDYEKAIELYKEALNIPGYHNNLLSKGALKEAELALGLKSQFEKLMVDGNQFFERKEWVQADKAFRNALSVSGYANNNNAIDSIKAVQTGLEIQQKQGETIWNETKHKVEDLLSDARRNSIDNTGQIELANSAMTLLKKVTDSPDMQYLSDLSRTEIATLKSDIISFKSKIVQIPIGFDVVKDPVSDTNGWASEIRHKATGIEMVYVVPGEFMMGSSLSEQHREKDEIQHKVKLTSGYYIGKFEVTQGQWETVMGNNPSNFKIGKDSPVETISWDDCQDFCRKLGGGFRLPTEAEWEFAARGGKKSKGFIYSGGDNLDEVGWYDKNSGNKTHSVGQMKANELGLHDMSGNVWEWCSDWHGEYLTGLTINPTGIISGSDRMGRGGCWFNSIWFARSAYRFWSTPSSRKSFLGFRLSLDIPLTGLKQNTDNNLPSYIPDNNSKPDISKQKQKYTPIPLSGNDWKLPEIGMEFVWINALRCWVGKYEVTNEEYRKYKVGHNSKSYGKHTMNNDRQPVVFVNFDDATVYARWLTEQECKAKRLPPEYSYRLPTKDEWTTFCQCGDNREYPWGNGLPPKYGNYHGQEGAGTWAKISAFNDGFPVTCPVEKSGMNDWGIYGVGGNVWECTVKSSTDLSFDAWRGASWGVNYLSGLRSVSRYDNNASSRNDDYGFRLVLSKTE